MAQESPGNPCAADRGRRMEAARPMTGRSGPAYTQGVSTGARKAADLYEQGACRFGLVLDAGAPPRTAVFVGSQILAGGVKHFARASARAVMIGSGSAYSRKLTFRHHRSAPCIPRPGPTGHFPGTGDSYSSHLCPGGYRRGQTSLARHLRPRRRVPGTG